ncbi:MAG: hypothetical protein Q8880_02105 [Bacteroidota bacterium]|nr:hypothetical protein [Bacteroidota bacterium]
MLLFDYIVIGSGPSGAMAAQTLCESGREVAMLDVGILPDKKLEEVPDNDFITIRENEREQYKFLIGKDFETVELENVKTGAQLTPQRKYLIEKVSDFIPVESGSFFPMESLAYGGLGSGWGLGCYVYSGKEIQKAGLNEKSIRDGYNIVAKRIGISASLDDDASVYSVNNLENVLPALKPDNSIAKILDAYQKKKSILNRNGIVFGNIPIAILSEDYNERHKTSYSDMDFYTDSSYSAYRPWITIDKLRERENFTYIDRVLVLTFNEGENVVEIKGRSIDTEEYISFYAKKIILAAGAIETARIVMRSAENKEKKVPILCNPYTYLPCVNTGMLGKPLDRFKTSMAQAVMFYDKTGEHENIVSVALYTYRSLLLYKLIKETPLNFGDGRIFMQYLQSAFVIAGIHHPDEYSKDKYLELAAADTFPGDKIKAFYSLDENAKKIISFNEKKVKKGLRTVGCIPIKSINPGFGSSIHYAGTIPYNNNNYLFSLNANGNIAGTENVYVADGSGFNYLPAKGITFTLMANAHVVAMNSMKN